MDERIKLLVAATEDFTLTQMRELIDALSDQMDRRYFDMAGYQYDEIRTGLLGSYNVNQLNSFKPWRRVSEANKKKFVKAYTQAQNWLSKLGISDSQRAKLINALVKRSDLLKEDQLLFTDVLQSLDQIDDLFYKGLPGYRRNPEAIKMLDKNIR